MTDSLQTNLIGKRVIAFERPGKIVAMWICDDRLMAAVMFGDTGALRTVGIDHITVAFGQP